MANVGGSSAIARRQLALGLAQETRASISRVRGGTADASLHDEILGILINTWSALAGIDDHELSDREEAARLLRDAARLHEIAAAACALPLLAARRA